MADEAIAEFSASLKLAADVPAVAVPVVGVVNAAPPLEDWSALAGSASCCCIAMIWSMRPTTASILISSGIGARAGNLSDRAGNLSDRAGNLSAHAGNLSHRRLGHIRTLIAHPAVNVHSAPETVGESTFTSKGGTSVRI
jgi:hypothetical protein